MSYRREHHTEVEEGPAVVWKDGTQIATGYLHARIVRETLVFWDGERTRGQVDYKASLSDTNPPLVDADDVVVEACGRSIPCNISDGEVHPSSSITPAL